MCHCRSIEAGRLFWIFIIGVIECGLGVLVGSNRRALDKRTIMQPALARLSENTFNMCKLLFPYV